VDIISFSSRPEEDMLSIKKKQDIWVKKCREVNRIVF